MAQHPAPFGLGRVPGPGENPDPRKNLSGFLEDLFEFFQGAQQVALNIIVEGFQGRNVKDAGVPGRPCSGDEPVERVQEGRESLPGSRRGGDEDVLPRGDLRPGLPLDVRGSADVVCEPSAYQRVKVG
jgi:hypothetical protein